MARYELTVTLTLLLTIAAGCDSARIASSVDEGAVRGEREVLVPLALEPAEPFDASPGEERHALVDELGSSTREEVISLSHDQEAPAGAEVVPVPQLILAALAGAPELDAEEQPARVEMIVESAGGEVEEVIYVASLQGSSQD